MHERALLRSIPFEGTGRAELGRGKKLSYDGISTESSDSPMGSFEARIPFQNLGVVSGPFIPTKIYHWIWATWGNRV